MKLVLVCGPWSSGTTAVSGMLDALGLDGCAPFFQTNDKRTKNSFESMAFRSVVDSIISEDPLRPKVPPAAALAALTQFKEQLLAARQAAGASEDAPIFLKYPAASLLIPQICKVFDTRLVYVLRPLQDIEATRVRRNWNPTFGAKGAEVIYSGMFNILLNRPFPTLVVRYRELLAAPLPHARQLAAFVGMKSIPAERLERAAAFVRQSGG